MGVSPAPAILATLEMESTVQVRYYVTFSGMERNVKLMSSVGAVHP